MRSGGGQPAPDLLEQMGYETRDITLPRIFFWIGVLFMFTIVAFIVAWGMYVFFVPDWAKLGQPSSIPVNRRLPPHPQIQIEPRRDMAEYRIAEDNALNPEGVERAMDTIATERGISGVKGDTVKGRGASYPGSGNYVTPSGGETGNTNVIESSNDPQVGENPVPGGAEKQAGEPSQTPASGSPSGTETIKTPEGAAPAAPVTPATP